MTLSLDLPKITFMYNVYTEPPTALNNNLRLSTCLNFTEAKLSDVKRVS